MGKNRKKLYQIHKYTVTIKVAFLRSCLYLTRYTSFHKRLSLGIIIAFAISSLLVSFTPLLPNVSAANTSTKAGCEAAGGTWKSLNSINNPNNSVSVGGTCSGAKLTDAGTSTTGSLDGASLESRTKSYAYLGALRHCVARSSVNRDTNTGGASNRVSEQAISSGKWFNDDQYSKASYLSGSAGAENGDTSCNSVVVTASKLWGFNTPLDLYCSFMPNDRVNNSSCTGSGPFKGNFGWDQSGAEAVLYQAIKDRIYGGATPEPGAQQLYLIYNAAFFGGCNPKESSGPAKDFGYSVTLVGADGKTETKVYEGVRADTTRYVYTGGGLTEVNESCRTIEARMNEYAPAYADYRAEHTEEPVTTAPSAADCSATPSLAGCPPQGKSSCAVEGVGWIVCPITNFLSGVADASYALITNFLVVKVALFDSSSGTSVAWGSFRNIANVAFVIAFIFIIFSQLTGQGVSNYGVKKTLPRLVVAAILVNVSFLICQLAVDITQIIGGSLKDLLLSIPVGTGDSPVPSATTILGDALSGTLIFGAAVAGVTVGAGIIALSISGPVLLAAVLALLMTVIILIGRQAGIVILITLAPLAFVAYILPNTEQWFKRWYKTFFALLMVYPIIALLYGGGQLASKIISSTANSAGTNDGTQFWLSITAIGVATIPLIMTPYLLKNALKGTGQLGAKLSGFASKANGRIGKAANTASRFGEAKQGIKNQFALRRAQRRGKSTFAKTVDNSRFGKALGLDRGAARALDAVNQESASEMKYEVSKMSEEVSPADLLKHAEDEFNNAIVSGDKVRARAAQNILLSSGNPGRAAVERAYSSNFSTLNRADRSNLFDSLRTDLKNSGLKGTSNPLSQLAITNDISAPTATDPNAKRSATSFSDYVNDVKTYSGLNPVELAGQSLDNLNTARRINAIDATSARAVLANTSAAALLDVNKRKLFEEMAGSGGIDTHTVINAGTQNETSVPRSASEIHADLTTAGGASTLSDAELLRIHHHASDNIGKSDPGRATLRTDTSAELSSRGIVYDKKAMRNSNGTRQ